MDFFWNCDRNPPGFHIGVMGISFLRGRDRISSGIMGMSSLRDLCTGFIWGYGDFVCSGFVNGFHRIHPSNYNSKVPGKRSFSLLHG